ncbi:hypothetical protein [Pseudoclavibacter helvolus]|uniref:hypothetical protein n=1 Tax=Pseudoclavibacter helvolus TaxID=255205 RepID=UPI003C779388
MTRKHVSQPVWAWHCDSCGRPEFELSFTQSGLPTPDEMRERGWHVADLYGDACPDCQEGKVTA